MELYHFGMSTCSQKVRLVLAEKEIPFVSREVNLHAGEQHAADYVKLNPMHVVPTLVNGADVYVESSLIIRYLNDLVAAHPMLPADARGRYRVSWWLNFIDKKVHPQAPSLTYAMGPRQVILSQSQEHIDAYINSIPDEAERSARARVIKDGIHAPDFISALREFLNMIGHMEETLAEQPWLSGEHFGLADATVVPYVLRFEQLGLGARIDAGSSPRVNDWFARVRARASYQTAVVDWFFPGAAEMMRKQGDALRPEVEQLMAKMA